MKGVRTRLVVWNVLAIGVILAVMGVALRIQLQENLLGQLDKELERDIAGVSTGGSISQLITTNTTSMPGLNNPNGLPGMTAGHGGGNGASIANTINHGLAAGMNALGAIGKGQ